MHVYELARCATRPEALLLRPGAVIDDRSF